MHNALTYSGQVVVHSSGALDRSVLAAVESVGARTGSVHPMMSFPTRRIVPLKGIRFAVEAADAVTRKELFALVKSLGGKPFAIDSKGKAMYHAGAMFGSPLLVATLAAGVRVLERAGVAEKDALALLGPMAAATVANVQKQGLARSFSGPLARGDAATIKLHRKALAGHPLEAQVYDSLAQVCGEGFAFGGPIGIRSGAGRCFGCARRCFGRESEKASEEALRRRSGTGVLSQLDCAAQQPAFSGLHRERRAAVSVLFHGSGEQELVPRGTAS